MQVLCTFIFVFYTFTFLASGKQLP